MITYVVAVMSFFDGTLNQYKVEASNKFEAVKLAMLHIATENNCFSDEVEYQGSDTYPKTFEDQETLYFNSDMPINCLEI